MKNQNIKRISFSELKNWKECSYRHRLIYIDKKEYFSGNEFTAFGTAIHTACENKLLDPEIKAIDVFNKSFEQEISLLETFDLKLVEDMRKQAIPLCENILPAIKSNFPDYKLISVEEEILEPITEFEAYGKKFKGFIDLVIKTPDEKYHIIDWKSCSWGWGRDKRNNALISYQLTYYKNFFSKKHNIEPKNIETYFALLKRTAAKDNVEILRMTSGPKKVENSLKVLENAVINIERNNFIKNRLNCKYCKFYKTENCT
tara:strand:+ start:591 stop:1367 length:777 start_codon:yes stop_codon:yes gene_type:complete